MDCLGFYEMSCAGICHSEERLVGLYQDCVLDLGSPGAAGTLLQSAATMNDRARLTPPHAFLTNRMLLCGLLSRWSNEPGMRCSVPCSPLLAVCCVGVRDCACSL